MEVTDTNYIYPPKPLYVPPSSDVFTRLDSDLNWIAEVKKNGWRMMIRKDPEGKIALWTRRKTLELSPLKELRTELSTLDIAPDSILDAELIDHRGTTKETLMVWGIFRWNGEWLNTIPYKEIMWRVAAVIPETTHLMKPPFVFEGKKQFYEKVLKESKENEGVVLKKLDAPVPFSVAGCPDIRTWIKVKPSM